MRTCYLIIIVCLAGFPALAQNDYLVTIQNDTLYGDVIILLPGSRDEPLKIKTDSETRQFSASEVRLSYIDGDFYKTIQLGEKYRVMKEIVDGYLGLYEFRPDESYEFGGRYLYKITNQGLEVSILFFRSSVSKFLEECPEIVKGLDNKKYGINHVEQLVRDYNDICVDKEMPSPVRDTPPRQVEESSEEQDKIAELKELNTLISDILLKRTNGEPVPQYMREALKSYADKDLNQLIQDLISELEEK